MRRIKSFCLEILPRVHDSLPQRSLRMRAHVEILMGRVVTRPWPISLIILYLCMAGETSHSLCERTELRHDSRVQLQASLRE
jgi:hypothetical protein